MLDEVLVDSTSEEVRARLLHTVKGNTAIYGFIQFSEQVHHAEEALLQGETVENVVPDPDPSAIVQTYVESLISGEGLSFSPVASSKRYCGLHYLVAPALDGGRGMPDGDDMLGASLYLEGEYSIDGESTSFSIRSTVAWGKNYELPAPLDMSDRGATVVVHRKLGALFDTVDFRTMDDKDIVRAVLKAVTTDVDVTLAPL